MAREESGPDDYIPSKIPGERPGREGGRRHVNRLARTRALCEAAIGCFLERGLDAVTIDDVVRAADTSKGTFYRYFEGKDELVGAIFRPVALVVTEAMDRCTAALEIARSPAELDGAYGELAQALLGVLLEHRDTVRLFLQERHGPATPARQPVRELDEGVLERAILMTNAGRASGLLKPVDPRVSAMMVVGGVQELLWQEFRGRGPEDPLRGAQDLIDIVLYGVRATGPVER